MAAHNRHLRTSSAPSEGRMTPHQSLPLPALRVLETRQPGVPPWTTLIPLQPTSSLSAATDGSDEFCPSVTYRKKCLLPAHFNGTPQLSHREDEYRMITHYNSQHNSGFYNFLSKTILKIFYSFMHPIFSLLPHSIEFFERKSNNTATAFLNQTD